MDCKRIPFVLAALIAITIIAGCYKRTFVAKAGVYSTEIRSGQVGPAYLYPDPNITPGKANTLALADLTATYTENCPGGTSPCTYAQSHRYVTSGEQKLIYTEYGVPLDKRNTTAGQIDHFVPTCAGGASDKENLWYQPAENMWNGKNYGYHEKDKLEAWMCDEIRAGRLDPKEAYERMTTDWVKFYLDAHLENAATQSNTCCKPNADSVLK